MSLKIRFFAALAIIIFGLGIGLQFSPLLAIQNIEIAGTGDTPQEEIRAVLREETSKRRLLIFPQTNIAFFDARSASAKLRERFPIIAEANMERTLARTVRVRIREHTKTMILAGLTEAHYLGEGGERIAAISEEFFIYDETASGTKRLITDIRDDAKKQLPVLFLSETKGEVSAPLFAAVKLLGVELPKRAVPVTAFVYETTEGKLIAKTGEGWSAYFDPARGNLSDQVEGLAAVLSQEIKDRKSISYIDLRFENRVYFK
ncbi:MAG: FtsQ-type POTRA domain-containing protein [Patescibacteria group bacterium]